MMKKFLLTFGLATILLSAKSQIIITGAMFDPQGADAPAVGVVAGDYTHKGGYEYMQFMATQDIDFAVTPFAVIRCVNGGATTGAEPDGWAAVGLARTFKWNLTSGKVSMGEFFYVGGPEKTAAGFLVEASTTYYPVLDLSSSKWIRTIAYSNGTTTPVGDDGIGIGNGGLFVNSKAGTAANPQGIAVFLGTTVDKNSVPIDVVFTGFENPLTSVKAVYQDNGDATFNGYLVPKTDHLEAGYFGEGTNTYAFLFQPLDNVGNFLKLGGVYDTHKNVWTTPRTSNYVRLVPGSGSALARSSFATLAMLEGNAAGSGGVSIEATKLISTLPVSLTTFTAKANKAGTVNLSWSTASEKDNAYFEVTRSTDGVNFTKVGQVAGNGTSNATNNYSYTDSKPVNGTNYYRLTQVDNDGRSAQSKVASAKVSLSASSLTVSVASNRNAIKVNYDAATDGQATFTIYNTSGVKLASSNQSVNAGANQITVPVALSNAVHVLKVSQAGVTSSVKF